MLRVPLKQHLKNEEKKKLRKIIKIFCFCKNLITNKKVFSPRNFINELQHRESEAFGSCDYILM